MMSILTNLRPNDELPKDYQPQRWPFPTKDNPLKPWTPSQVKEYNDKRTEDAPL